MTDKHKRPTVWAFDFDGTIVEHEFPAIGKPRQSVIEFMRSIWDEDTRIAIWTCRNGDHENVMRRWLLDNNVPFDWINENPLTQGFGFPKIYADHYVDDHNYPLEAL